MNYIDAVIITAVAVAFVTGAVLGIVRLVFYLLGLLLGAFAASYVEASLPFNPWVVRIVSISVWILVSFSSGALGWMLQKKLRNFGVSFLDRLWGALFSTISISFALAVVLLYVKSMYPPASAVIDNSFAADFLFSSTRSVFSSFNR